MDLEIRWSDNGGAVNPAKLTVRDLPADNSGLGPDLSGVWTVTRLDTAGAVLEETVPGLLKGGAHQLLVSVADTAGNVRSVYSPYFFLPPATYSRTIDLYLMPSCQPETGVNLALSPDRTHGYAPFHGCIAVFRTDPPDSVHFVSGVPYAYFAANIVVDTATGLAYIGGGGVMTGGFGIFDTRTEQVVGRQNVPTYVTGLDVHDSRIFIGEGCSKGPIMVLDKHTRARPIQSPKSSRSLPTGRRCSLAPTHRQAVPTRSRHRSSLTSRACDCVTACLHAAVICRMRPCSPRTGGGCS